MGHRFSLTEKQIRDLIAATPPGYVPSVTVSFAPADEKSQDAQVKLSNPADLIDP